MKIAVVYNRESRRVINLFGVPNRETYGLKSIKRITEALKAGGHRPLALEGDKDLLDHLEEFMPRVMQGERPGMVFNLSYGIQGQARYTHVPGMLEMAGVPYVGSGPLAHSLALDKVVAKMIFKQEGIPTPDFAVLRESGFDEPRIAYPLIVKPKSEAVSFGIRVVHTESELREAAENIFQEFQQPVLAEQYIAGREINVGLLGNNPPEALPPAELIFGEGPQIYTYEDKTRQSGRQVAVRCPAQVEESLAARAQEIAMRAFAALGCNDCARVDMRVNAAGEIFVLELNSLPSLGEHGSYVHAASAVGLDFAGLINRLVSIASARYFGTPSPPEIAAKPSNRRERIFTHLTARRDRIEKRIEAWTRIASRTADPVGIRTAAAEADRWMRELGLQANESFTDQNSAWLWETRKTFEHGTLFIGHLDVPIDLEAATGGFHRDPEYLYGEGVGSSRGPLAMLEFALGALRHVRLLHNRPIGVLLYGDEGRACQQSGNLIRAAAEHAAQVLVLHAGNPGDRVITQRRGRRTYRMSLEGPSRRPGQRTKRPEAFLRVCAAVQAVSELSSHREHISVSPIDLRAKGHPMVLPHAFQVLIAMTYLDAAAADEIEERMRAILKEGSLTWKLDLLTDRPPLQERRRNLQLYKRLTASAGAWEIPLAKESSLWPSAAGLVPTRIPALCGIGPTAINLHTPQEAIERISLVQRTLLLTEFLSANGGSA